MVPSSNDERIRLHRAFLRYDHDQEANELSDQQRKVPQPPLVKKPTGNPTLELPRDFRASIRETDILSIINHWESHRVYTEEKMTLTDLSFLLWSTQGVKASVEISTPPCGPCLRVGLVTRLKPISPVVGWKVCPRGFIITCRWNIVSNGWERR